MAEIILTTPDELKTTIREILLQVLSEQKTEARETTYLTRFEVCDILHVSLPTLNKYTKEGLITARKIGTRVLYLPEEIEDSVAQVATLKYQRR